MQTAPNIPNRPRSASSFPLLELSLSNGSGAAKQVPPSELPENPPERGAHPWPLKTTEAFSHGPGLPQKPQSSSSHERRQISRASPPFLPTLAPQASQTRARADPSGPCPPFPASLLFHPFQTHASLKAMRTSGVDPSPLPGRPPLSPGSSGRAPELRAPATTPHPPRAPARAASPRRPTLTREAHDIMEHGTGDFQEQNPPTRFQ